MSTTAKCPTGLRAGGQKLWKAIDADHELDAPQLVQLEEACRAKDRLDQLDDILAGRGVLELLHFRSMLTEYGEDERHITVTVDGVLAQANTTANLMKQLLAALRLPDEQSGKKPQRRGPRGVQSPSVPGGKAGKVSSLDRARAAKSG